MTDRIKKFLDSLDGKTRERLKEKMLLIKKDFRSVEGVKGLKGKWRGCFRLRVGKIRIIFREDEEGEIEVVDIDYRGGVY